MLQRQEVGNIGENIATELLISKGHTIIVRNYRKSCGEIDVITKFQGVVHFVEVKTISRENFYDVSRKTSDFYRPEENMHPKKIERLHRTIQNFLMEQNIDKQWQLDLVAVDLFIKDKKASCRFIENVL